LDLLAFMTFREAKTSELAATFLTRANDLFFA